MKPDMVSLDSEDLPVAIAYAKEAIPISFLESLICRGKG